MKTLSPLKVACMVGVFCAVTTAISPAQVTRTTLKNFDNNDGANPGMVLTQGADGNLYGTTPGGGNLNACEGGGCGTVFKIGARGGNFTPLYDFCSQPNCADGSTPIGSLAQAADGSFYGTTYNGGSNSSGTVFNITPAGALTTLYSFCALKSCADGKQPFAGLVRGSNGNLYGTTRGGGANGGGTVFEITPTGKLTTIYKFCFLPNCSDGDGPMGNLAQGSNGSFYGTTSGGGGYGYGTIFEITPQGKLTTLFSFDGTNGSFAISGLIQAADGNFYGEATTGGSSGYCGFNYGCGTIFKITPAGQFTTLYNFCSQSDCTDSGGPRGPLVQGTDGNFYGTTRGLVDEGTAFEITPDGTLTKLFGFCRLYDCADGSAPSAGLLQATNGTFYGTTEYGGKYHPRGELGYGTIYYFSTGLGPFVKTQPTFADEGATIGIFGQGFNSSSVVQFGGVQATSVKFFGAPFLEARVPAGALTGSVTVTTNGTTLTSNQVFRVSPQVLSFSPPSGAVGTQVTINGTGLTQTTGVGFGDNVPAQFTVNSDTQITATVPSGAKTGPINVVTKGGTGISSKTFTVN